jgi:hypothetical protein
MTLVQIQGETIAHLKAELKNNYEIATGRYALGAFVSYVGGYGCMPLAAALNGNLAVLIVGGVLAGVGAPLFTICALNSLAREKSHSR